MENKRSATERNVAANVRRLRAARGWTLADLSSRLAEAGHQLGVPVLSKIELGDRGIGADDLVAFSAVYDVGLDALVADPELVAHEDRERLWTEHRELMARRRELDEEHERNLAVVDAQLDAVEERLMKAMEGRRAGSVLGRLPRR